MRLVRQVVQSLVHRPWYAASIVSVMAVGCALLTSVLAIVDGVLFKPLDYPGERDLVAITVSSSRDPSRPSVAREDVAAWAQAAPGAAITGFYRGPVQSPVGIAVVQPNFFDVIGVRPALGGFAAEDFDDAVSLISPRIITDEIFRSEFGGDPGAIGRVVILDPSSGYGYRVAGVMPPGFVFPADRFSVGYITAHAGGWRAATFHQVVARLPAAMTAAELQTRVLAAATARNAERASITTTRQAALPIDRVDVEPLGRAVGAASRPLFAALLLGAGLLVTIAALNASSLMAARSVDRRRELAVRRALGATPFDIGRLLLVEAWLLVGAGAAIGLLIAAPLLRITAALLPGELALFRTPAIDGRVAAFGVAAAAALAGVVAIWPLRLASRGETSPGHARSVTGQARSSSWRLVVSVQVALALVLTVAGSLLVGSLLSVYARTPPITTENILTVSVRFQGVTLAESRLSAERTARVNALIERVRTVPGVDVAAFTAYDLLDHAYVGSWFTAPATAVNPRRAVMLQAVTADYYRIVQPQLVAGRWPTPLELGGNEPVIVVSEGVASRYWPGASAIGRTLTERGEAARTFTVVGVVKEVRWASWDEEAWPMIYGPYALLARQSSSYLLIRTSAGTSRVAAEVLRVMGDTDPWLDTRRVAPLEHLFVDSVRPRRFRAWLFGSFAFASLFVVGLGLFGQLGMSTARRTREVGIRMTCGATRGSIARLILGEQLVPVVVGLVAGAIAAAWAVRFVGSYLYQVTSSDARVWAAAIGLILLTAAAGTLVPAVRASRIEPTQALRSE
jgi:predicted permease